VDLQGGSLWRADFHLGLLPRIQGELGVELRSAVRPSEPARLGEDLRKRMVTVEHAVPVHVGAVPARNLRLTVLLPEGAAYVPGSSRLNGAKTEEPDSSGEAVTFRLGDAPAEWEGTLRFDSAMPAIGTALDLTVRASLAADTPTARNTRTPVVENTFTRQVREDQLAVPDMVLRPQFAAFSADISAADRRQLKRITKDLERSVIKSIVVTGHTDSRPIRWTGRKKFADNYALSTARADSVARELVRLLKLKPGQVTVIGKGPDEPVADNMTAQGRARNRRVELKVENRSIVVWSDVRGEAVRSGMKGVATIGMRPGDSWADGPRTADIAAGTGDMPEYNEAWFRSARPGTAWVWPPERFYPSIAATKLAVQHNPAQEPRVILNGLLLDGLYSEGTVRKADGTAAVSIWKGVHLQNGDNVLELVVTDPAGNEVLRTSRIIHYSGDPARAELVPERSRLVADGRQPAVLAVRLLDKEGHPAREGISGEFTVDAPHVAQQRLNELQQAPLTAPASDRIRYTVGSEGIALLELAPTTQAGEAVVRILLGQGAQEVRAWLRPETRDWVLVGLAEGTWGYDVIRGSMESAGAAGREEDLYREGRVAFYAKGMVKGAWLLTAAYNSSRAPDGRTSMYQTVDPNKYYLLYGDATEQLHDAPSAKHIYVKLERDQFYALFGDYSTGLIVAELSRYSRNLTGFKSEFKGDRFEYNLFAADTDQAHVRDELQGDGTSGLYRLSRRNVVMNSEQVTIQSRDRFRSEVIVKEQMLARHLDYTIDYESGTLFFKSPVPSRDESFNPVFIAIEYETFDKDNAA
jgi:outer membrane protein OmpA-like peptidoglycan-associated protein